MAETTKNTTKEKKVRAPMKKVPEDQMNEKYWAQRRVNLVATRASREKNLSNKNAMVRKAKLLEAEIKDIDEKIGIVQGAIKLNEAYILSHK